MFSYDVESIKVMGVLSETSQDLDCVLNICILNMYFGIYIQFLFILVVVLQIPVPKGAVFHSSPCDVWICQMFACVQIALSAVQCGTLCARAIWRCALVTSFGMRGSCRELFCLNKSQYCVTSFPHKNSMIAGGEQQRPFKFLGLFWPCLHPLDKTVSIRWKKNLGKIVCLMPSQMNSGKRQDI